MRDPVYPRRLVKVNSLFDPVDMSQAAPYAPAGPDQPAPRPRRTRLFLIPGGIVLLLIAIPGATYAFAENQLSQAQTSEAHGAYTQARRGYGTAQTGAGNPVLHWLLGC